MQTRSSPSGAPEVNTVRFCASALETAATPQTEVFKAADCPSVAGAGLVDSVANGLAVGVAMVGRSQLRSVTIRNRVAGTATSTIAVQRFPADDLSAKASMPLQADGTTTLTVDNTLTTPQHFSIPLASNTPGPGTGLEDGDVLVLAYTHGNITGPTNISIEVNLQALPDRTIDSTP